MPDPISMGTRHRERCLERLSERGAAALVMSARPSLRNADSEHRYRPDSDLWWLTGFEEPGSALLLLPAGADRGPRSILFLRERNRAEEVWTGRRLGVDAATERLGVDEAAPIGELWTRLPELLRGTGALLHRLGADEARDRELIALLARLRGQAARGAALPTEVLDPGPVLGELRLIKDDDELELMRRAAALSVAGHRAAMAATAPGVGEHEIDALLSYTFRNGGGTGNAYTNIVAGGDNACVLHYVDNDRELAAGDLLLVDAGAEVEYYASDLTRTWPVDGRFSPEQRRLYELVLEAQRAAIETVGPGLPFSGVHRAAVAVLARGLVELGILEGPADEALEQETYRRFYMHRTSHWLGLDVHDCGSYAVDGESRSLEPGMVLTVEPGLYIDPEDESVEHRWRGIGIRIEDDVAITAGGREVLTEGAPKSVEEVEAACGRAPSGDAGGGTPSDAARGAVGAHQGRS